MISKRDVQLGKIALKAGFIDKDQLTKCLALKKKLVKTKGKKVALGSLLLKKGYLTKDQLEECVRLHNEKLDASGDETAKKRSRRSKRAKAEGEKDEAATSARKKRKKKKEAGKETNDEVEATTATATKKTKTSARSRSKTSGSTRTEPGESRKSKRAKTSREAARSKRSKKESGKSSSGKTTKKKKKTQESDVSDIGAEVESAVDTVDAALFASAQESDVETDRKRLIACPSCGKKYRVKKRQVGKRFSCRRCEHRVKVPKDLFERPIEVRSAVEVEEFVLGSQDTTVGEDSEDEVTSKSKRKKQIGKAAGKANAAVDKVAKTSIRELANKAATTKPKSLAPKQKFGVQGLVTMLVLGGMLLGVIFGGMQLFVWGPAAEKQANLEKGAKEELENWSNRLNTVLAAGKAASEAKKPRAIASALTELSKVQEEANALIQGDNQKKAAELLTSLEVPKKALELRMDQGRLLLEQGGPSAATDALLVLKLAAKMAPENADVQLLVARTQVKARRYRDAAGTLKALSESNAKARVLRGLALELGDVPSQAAQVYAGLDDPLKGVLTARAHVVAGAWSSAISALEDVSGLQGSDLALSKMVEGRARAGAGEHSKAMSAFDMAVANAGDNPVPLLARAEYQLARGKPKSALKDAEASTTKGASARGFLAQGDAYLALLDAGKAKTAYRNAMQGEPTPVGRKIADEVGAFFDPLAPDARVVARVRLAFLIAGKGGKGAHGEAEQLIGEAINAAPFSPYALAALVLLNKVNKVAGANDDAYLSQALNLSKRLDAQTAEDVIRTPETGFLLLANGAHLLENNRLDPALKVLNQVAKLAPNLEAAARCLRGRVFLEKRLASKANGEFRQSIDLEKAHPGYRRGRQLAKKIKKGDDASFKRLERGLKGLLAQNPYFASAYVLLARGRVRTRKPEQYKQALKDLTQAIEINPGLREAYTTRGFLYLRYLPKNLRDTAKGGKDIKKALELEGRSPRASSLYGLALYHWNRGDAKAAHLALDHCVKRDAKYRDAYKLQETIYRFEGKGKLADKAKRNYERLK